MTKNLIVAMSNNLCIGNNNELPWKLKTDMKFFRETTTNNAVIMGRKTFESMGSRPLKNRLNIVISNTLPSRVEGIIVVRDIDEAFTVCQTEGFEPFIIGGANIYEQTFDLVDVIYITMIDTEIDGDAFFIPELDYRLYDQEVIAMGDISEIDDHKFTIYKLTKK